MAGNLNMKCNFSDSLLHFVSARTTLRAVCRGLPGRCTLNGLGQRCGEEELRASGKGLDGLGQRSPSIQLPFADFCLYLIRDLHPDGCPVTRFTVDLDPILRPIQHL